MFNQISALSTRSGLLKGTKHLKVLQSFLKKIKERHNLANLINRALEKKEIEQDQIAPFLNALLIEKFKYQVKSFNLKETLTRSVEDVARILLEFDAFDIVLAYNHPQLGQLVINPKLEESWAVTDSIRENELIVVYIGFFGKYFNRPMAAECAEAIKKLLNGKEIANPHKYSQAYIEELETKKKSAADKVTAIENTKSVGNKKLSPRYGVKVTNSAFSEGNVEAWLRIIKSYEATYPGTKVLVFYEGEQIRNLNNLFKWGTVSHRKEVYFALLGEEFYDISKLRRYLSQGSSNSFEDFLKGDPSKILLLF